MSHMTNHAVVTATVFSLVFFAAGVPGATARVGETTEHVRQTISAKDESRHDASFAKFRDALLAAAKSGDVEALLQMISPSVLSEYEPTSPQAVLARFDVSESRPWHTLVKALELGSVRTPDGFVAPYPFALHLDRDEAAIIGRNVRVRAEPSAEAKVVAVLSMEVVKRDRTHETDAKLFYRAEFPTGQAAWVRVVLPDGQTGYVYGAYAWTTNNIRFLFEKQEGQWKLSGLSASD